MAEMQKTYDPSSVEERLYRHWEESGAFHQEPDPSRKPFTIVMPPPNITGQLHMGHALDNMMQDVLTRYHRMLGDNTLWLPGTDHASIATEVKLVEQLAEEGKTKADISPRRVFGARLEVAREVRRPHRQAAAQARLLLRLAARALYDGQRLQPRGHGSVRASL